MDTTAYIIHSRTYEKFKKYIFNASETHPGGTLMVCPSQDKEEIATIKQPINVQFQIEPSVLRICV